MNETEARQSAARREEPKQGQVRTYTKWQMFFLDRLRHLVEVNRETAYREYDESREQALKRAMFSTLLDCDAAGVGEEARSIMARESSPR